MDHCLVSKYLSSDCTNFNKFMWCGRLDKKKLVVVGAGLFSVSTIWIDITGLRSCNRTRHVYSA